MTTFLYILAEILAAILAIFIIRSIVRACKRRSANRIENNEYYHVWMETLRRVKQGEIIKVDNKHFIIDNGNKLSLRDNKFFCDLHTKNEVIEGYEALEVSYQVYDIVRKNFPFESKRK